MNIYISESNIFKRIYTKHILKQALLHRGKKIMNLRDTSTLSEMLAKTSLASFNNVYFLRTDLSNQQELAVLKKIRKKDSLGHIIVLVKNTESLEQLFTYKIRALGYVERNTFKRDYKEKIIEYLDYTMKDN